MCIKGSLDIQMQYTPNKTFSHSFNDCVKQALTTRGQKLCSIDLIVMIQTSNAFSGICNLDFGSQHLDVTLVLLTILNTKGMIELMYWLQLLN